MGNGADELIFHLFRLFKALGHSVDGAAQAVHLIPLVAGDGQTNVQLTPGDAGGGALHLSQRHHDAPHEVQAEEEESAFEKWVGDHLGKKAEDILMAGAALVGGLFAILLFTVLPTVLVGGLGKVVILTRWPRVILEAVLKVAIFLSYMVAISKMKEIHRVFEYHGAEHKTIACYEAGDELTVENVRKYTRFHPRCGTSFLILVVIVSVFLYSVLPWSSTSLRVLFKLLLLPVVMGISYELLKWCGRSDNIATRIIRQPGLWVQRLTVFEPDDSMIEVAIAAVTPVLPEDPEDGKW